MFPSSTYFPPRYFPPRYFGGGSAAAAGSIHELILAAVQARLQALTFAGLATPPGNLPPERIYRFEVITDAIESGLIEFPAVIVSSAEFAEETRPLANVFDVVEYPVLVTLLDRVSAQEAARHPTYKLWRQQIAQALRYQRLSGTGIRRVCGGKPTPLPPGWKPPKWDFYSAPILFRYQSWEART